MRIKEKVKSLSKFSPVTVDVAGFVVSISSLEKLKVEDLKDILRGLNRESKKNAEKLLFLEVREGFKNFEFFKDMSEEIRRKIETGNFKLAIQGIFDVQTGKPVHYEVLLRFVDNDGNIVPAYKFIDYIYEFRLIHLLDVAVLKKILENSGVFTSKSIYVNISPVTFKLSSSLSEVERLVEDIRSNGINIGFEITEQAIVEDIDLIVNVMRGRDIPVGIDDFGTGYVSFSKFIDFVEAIDVEILKVDGSYVKKLVKENSSDKAEKVIRAIISMSRSLGIKTVAGFVENKEILEKIKQLKVDYGQGYLFMKPKVVV
ncbi:EAL domain-containing protein [Desulfurobacterium atlanticum]|uniref:EAL domain, c-di-GMP-specific phosphodiesterase class I (Or its enzymatically inactive variant) n=1 Tax=Desulfurobacterium atlanticum TaxID=240169 RepID=A0A239ACT1_9BACT|nr:EAL domain-containing protein [Desulfurobacterium atlanticum]SNR93141.1 EAL domain, c-di-GMP-specific phosphodiesterase class I (or its enzymatically inactive variant) [Desulfurobacterium atlanticum]